MTERTSNQVLFLQFDKEKQAIANEDCLAYMAYIGHELRSPIAAMCASVRFLTHTELSPEQGEAVRILERQLDQMQSLVQNIRDLAIGSDVLRLETFNLREVLSASLETLQPSITERSQTLARSCSADITMVTADRNRLIQVFCNLIDNASKYSPDGSTIHVTTDLLGSSVRVRIRDEGSGIEKESLPHVFEPFYRADPSLASNVSGSGLGLAIAERLVSAHNGSLTLRSDGPGTGCEATVILPVSEAGLD